MAFDPDKYLSGSAPKAAGGFDPDAYLASDVAPQLQQKKPSTSVPQTLAEQFGNAATFGHLPQLQGAVGALLSNFDPNIKINKELEAKGIKVVEAPRNYATIRDETSKRLKTEESENPIAATIGKLAGIAGTVPLTAGATAALGVGRAATALGRMGQAALGGSIAGGLQNPETQDVNDPLGLKARLTNAALGAVTSGGLQRGAEALGKAGSTIGKALAGSKPGGSVYDNVGPGIEQSLTKAQELAQNIGGKAGRLIATGTGASIGGAIGGLPGAGIGGYVADKLKGVTSAIGSKTALGAVNTAAKIANMSPTLTVLARENPMKFGVLAQQILAPKVPQPAPGEGYAILNDTELVKAFRANPDLVNQVKDPDLKAAIMASIQ